MKQHHLIASVLAALTTLPLSLTAGEKEKVVPLSEVPAPVAAAFEKHAAGGKIVKVEQDEENGKITYEAQIKVKDAVSEVSVDAKGKLVSVEDVIPLAEVPAAVRAAIEKEAGEGKAEKVERVKEGGKTTYEAVIAAKGKREEVVFSETGKVVQRENKNGQKD